LINITRVLKNISGWNEAPELDKPSYRGQNLKEILSRLFRYISGCESSEKEAVESGEGRKMVNISSMSTSTYKPLDIDISEHNRRSDIAGDISIKISLEFGGTNREIEFNYSCELSLETMDMDVCLDILFESLGRGGQGLTKNIAEDVIGNRSISDMMIQKGIEKVRLGEKYGSSQATKKLNRGMVYETILWGTSDPGHMSSVFGTYLDEWGHNSKSREQLYQIAKNVFNNSISDIIQNYGRKLLLDYILLDERLLEREFLDTIYPSLREKGDEPREFIRNTEIIPDIVREMVSKKRYEVYCKLYKLLDLDNIRPDIACKMTNWLLLDICGERRFCGDEKFIRSFFNKMSKNELLKYIFNYKLRPSGKTNSRLIGFPELLRILKEGRGEEEGMSFEKLEIWFYWVLFGARSSTFKGIVGKPIVTLDDLSMIHKIIMDLVSDKRENKEESIELHDVVMNNMLNMLDNKEDVIITENTRQGIKIIAERLSIMLKVVEEVEARLEVVEKEKKEDEDRKALSQKERRF
jgi:hypothetical protein